MYILYINDENINRTISTVITRTIKARIEMASSSTPDPDLDAFLKNIRLFKYREEILNIGVEQIDDLQDILDDKVLTDIGMASGEINRFKRKVTEVLRSVSLQSSLN